ncbi:MAG TPA: thioredoxin domain-containing protein, partial [Pyrinomonadaceae bacterium]
MFKHTSRAALLALLFAVVVFAQGARAQVFRPQQQAAPQPTPAGGAASVFKAPVAAQQTPATPQPAAPQPTPQGGTMLVRSEGHEWAPLLEQKLDYKDWTFKRLQDGTPVSLRELSKGKKLVLVVYFAPWCGNWKAEAPTVWKFYDKYKSQGF